MIMMDLSLLLEFIMCPLLVEMIRAFLLSIHPAFEALGEDSGDDGHMAADKTPGETTNLRHSLHKYNRNIL